MNRIERKTSPKYKLVRLPVHLLLLLLLAGIASGEQVSPDTGAKRTYIFKGDRAYPPYEFLENGRATGFNVEVLRAVARAMDLDIQIDLGAWNKSRQAFEAGQADGLTGFYQTEERARIADFSVPVSVDLYALFTQKKSPVKKLEEAWEGTLIVQKGDVACDYLRERGFPGVLIETTSPAEALYRLAAGEGDAALLQHTQGVYLCKQMELSTVAPVQKDLFSCTYSFAVRKGDDALLTALNEGLRIIMADGEYGALYMRWFRDTARPEPPRYILYFSIALGVTLAALLLNAAWTYMLRRQVRIRTAALLESETRYRILFENSSDALFLLGKEVLDCNSRACELLGMPREMLLKMPSADFSPPRQPDGRDSLKAAEAYIEAALSGRPQLFSWVHKRHDGKVIDTEVMLSAVPGLGATVCLGAVRDLSARKEAEHAIRRERDLVRVIMEISPVGIVMLDAEGTIVFVNARAERILRLKRAEICGRAYNDPRWRLSDLEGNPISRESLPFHQVIHSGKPVYDIRYAIEHPGGARTVISVSSTPLVNEAGAFNGMVAAFDDITAKIEEEQEREARWRRVEKQQAAIIRVARDKAVAEGDFSRASGLIVSLAVETLEVTSSSLWLFDDHSSRLHCVAAHKAGEGPVAWVADLDTQMIPDYVEALNYGRHVDAADANHDPRTMQLLENYLIPNEVGALLGTPIRLGGKLTGVLCNEHHGGVRYWRFDELQFAAELADQAAQAFSAQERHAMEARMETAQHLENLGILAGGLAHDFNNLLTAMLGNVELALMDIPPDNPASSSLKEIQSLSVRAAELCRSMLACAGKGRFVAKPFKLNEEIRQTGHIMGSSIGRNVRLLYELEENLPFVQADKSQINQVIMNLILNASEAIGTEDGTITIKTHAMYCDKIFIQESFLTNTLSEGRYVAIEVSDNGSGMNAETLEKIFNPFFSTKFVGRGMGLSAVLGIVRSHKGGIRVHSVPGEGSIFTVLLPTGEAAAPASAKLEKKSDLAALPARVLLVGGTATSQRVTSRMLCRLGYQVALAASLDDAAMQFHQGPLDCILIDHALNQSLNEIRAKELSALCVGIPLLLATDLDENEALQICGRYGFSGFLRKPLMVAALAAKLQSLTGR